MLENYVKKILGSKVYDLAVESPLSPAPLLSRRLGLQVSLKREDMQSVYSFKLRGAYNMMAHMSGPLAEDFSRDDVVQGLRFYAKAHQCVVH